MQLEAFHVHSLQNTRHLMERQSLQLGFEKEKMSKVEKAKNPIQKLKDEVHRSVSLVPIDCQ